MFFSYEEPTKQGIGNDNIGNKLLQKMGWSEGQGLGKQGQGIVAPIQVNKCPGYFPFFFKSYASDKLNRF